MEQQTDAGYFLQQIYSSLSDDAQMQNFDSNALINLPHLNLQNIDNSIEKEMQRIKGNYLRKENEYVERMLLENPIVIERRNNSCNKSSEEEIIDVVTVSESATKGIHTISQQYRAEACRRSRYNNKIRKAKSKYRHQYVTQKLLQSSQLFNCIVDLINQAEEYLLTKSITKNQILNMRNQYGVEKSINCIRKFDDLPVELQD